MEFGSTMPRNASERLKLHEGRGNLVIFVLKTSANDEKVINHLAKVAV
jgi:hypothetical protein